MHLLKDKKILIVGVASKRSIAYGLAQAMHEQGAELAFTYQNDRLADRVQTIAKQFNSTMVLPCDVSSDKEIDTVFTSITEKWGQLDAIVHSVAYAPQDQLQGDFIDAVTREGFHTAHDISSYSLAALAKAGLELLKESRGSMITVTYLGAERTFPNYNTMGVAKASLEATVKYLAASMGQYGIRVNAVSAGPIRTLAAAGISNFKKMLDFNKQATPLQDNVTIEQVGNAGAFLCSNMASGITGEVLHVDNGFHAVGLNPITETE